MILFVYGTTGELIKLAPVLVRLRSSGAGYLSVTTGQQVEQIPELLDSLGLPQPDLWLARGSHGRDLRRNTDVPGWATRTVAAFARHRRHLRRTLAAGTGRPLVMVHGDTMTTVFGALMGRLMRVPVAHLEAGLRSFSIWNPFPEEIDRRLTSAMASINYSPGAWAASNLRRGTVVDTGSNTIRDSLALCSEKVDPALPLPRAPFGLVSLHRFELLNNRGLLLKTLEAVVEQAHKVPLVFVDHPVTVAAIQGFGFERMLDAPGVYRIPRLPFLGFVPVMRRSSFLFTDSGGNQEECFYLDIPCLVHRRRTERRQGLGENVVLSKFDFDLVRDFFGDPGRFRRRETLADESPSDLVVSDLIARGFAAPTARATIASS
jgi:UDP-N-acetylglucosamine 2-epimerase (non-hydrolysing)